MVGLRCTRHRRLALDRGGAAAYREGDPALHWYKVVSGTGCTSKLLPDGRRQIGTFLHAGDFFGFEALDDYGFAAEAITDMIVIRYPKQGTEALALLEQRGQPPFPRDRVPLP